jgi:hypothetical protein
MTHTHGTNLSLLARAAAVAAACLAAGPSAAAAQKSAARGAVSGARGASSGRAGGTAFAVKRPLARASRLDPSTNPAPKLAIDGPLTLCGGAPVPTTLFDDATLCLEQELTGMTEEKLLNRSLDVAFVNLTFAAGPHTPPPFSTST